MLMYVVDEMCVLPLIKVLLMLQISQREAEVFFL